MFFLLHSKINLIYVGGNHSVAIGSDNSIWCWGSNKYLQIGQDKDCELELVCN